MVAQWNVGDTVLVPSTRNKNDQSLAQGVICDHRGSGWYSVQLGSGADKRIVKFRGTQLERYLSDEAKSQASMESSAPFGNFDNVPFNISSLPVMDVTNPVTKTKSILKSGSPGPAPPPPTIIDLDAAVRSMDDPFDPVENVAQRNYLQHVAHHSSFEQWVVFTDLHCSASTMDATIETLRTVHQHAVKRKAGILFLGDFWHHRRTLRIDCLNTVLHELSTWTVPMVMIPGNHDQVTLGGLVHGLTPLEHAYRVTANKGSFSTTFPGPLVFSHATVFANALFIPHIRDNAIMESVLQSTHAQNAEALFVHADITGAYMNDLIVSLGGVPPRMFPGNKPIYSGHFHKPHTVKQGNKAIEYLGSPYEVSLAEAQQPKALAVLDASNGWKCIEKIPLSIGRKHFRPLNEDEFLALRPKQFGTRDRDTDVLASISVDSGDRVLFSVDKDKLEKLRRSSEVGETNPIDTHVSILRQKGITVELRETRELPVGPMESASPDMKGDYINLSLESTWTSFIEGEVRRGAMTEEKADFLSKPGLDILADLDSVVIGSMSGNKTDVELYSLTVEGFGPFRQPVTYPLLERGLVLLRGSNKDGGSDSNGSGKSSLAMSALWAFTGSIDPRPLQDSKVSDVVHDSCKAARVTVKGAFNGVEFSVTRTKTATKGNIVFTLGGEDLTTQSAKETQELIDETFGVNSQILARTIFNGQHALNDLLEATDSKLKDELATVVPLSGWQDAVTLVRKMGREAGKRASEIEGMLTLREKDLERLDRRLEDATSVVYETEASLRSTEQSVTDELEGLYFAGNHCMELDDWDARLLDASEKVKALERSLRSKQTERDEVMKSAAAEATRRSSFLDSAADSFRRVEARYGRLAMDFETATKKVQELEKLWSLDLSSGELDTAYAPVLCPTCGQSVSSDDSGHDLRSLKGAMEDDISVALLRLHEAQTMVQDVGGELAAAKAQHGEALSLVKDLNTQKEKESQVWSETICKQERALADAREAQSVASFEYTLAVKAFQQKARRDELQSQIDRQHQALSNVRAHAEAVEAETMEYRNLVKELQASLDTEEKQVALMSDLSDAFGQRGVQAFVLQSEIEILQTLTQSFLDDFSDGTQKLSLSLDAGDRISRRAYVRSPDGAYHERPLASLSGGQWRRCSLALNLGYADLVARRGRFRSSLYIMDEPLTHLDRSGRADVGRVFRKLLRRSTTSGEGGLAPSTIIVILQDLAAEELGEAFDCIDEVVKCQGTSQVFVDEEL